MSTWTRVGDDGNYSRPVHGVAPPQPIPDIFWGSLPPGAHPRIAENRFWGTAERPAPRPTFLGKWSRHPARLALVMLGIGFFSVFVVQMDLHFQIVLGAPIFEEFLKFGLALLLVSYLPDPHGRGALWALVVPMRIIASLAVGALFGWLEHVTTYPSEDNFSYAWRVAFHSVSAGGSMVTYTLLEPLRETRARWFSTLVPTFLHYVNNSLAVLLGLSLLAFKTPLWLGSVISGTVVALLVISILVMPWFGRAVRTAAMRQVALRFEAPGAPLPRRAVAANGPHNHPTNR